MRVNNHFVIRETVVVGTTNQGDKFQFDLEDYNKVIKYSWWTDKDGYISTQHKGVNIKLHQLIMPTIDNLIVDHIDRNKLNYRKNNLRLVSIKENNFNKSLDKRNKSGVTGVFWSKRNSKWKAKIGFNKQCIHLGFFTNLNDAVLARLKAEIRYFGEHAPQKHLLQLYGLECD